MQKNLLLVVLLSISLVANAQEWPGYSATNYAGVNAITFNPAEIVNGRYLFDLNLAGVNLGFDNNFLGLHHPGFYMSKLLKDKVNYSYIEDTYGGIDAWDKGKTKRVERLTVSGDALGPSLLIPINPNNAFALFTRARVIRNIDDGAAELSKNAIEELKFDPLLMKTFTSDHFSVDAMAWREFGLTYAAVIPISQNNKNHFLKAGLSLKYLAGYLSAYMYGKSITYNFTNSDTISLYDCSVSYGHTSNLEIDPFTFFNAGVQGTGIGGDFGIVYEYRPDYQKFLTREKGGEWFERKDLNKYKIKAGFSVLDLGGIKYNKDEDSYDFTADVDNWNVYPLSVHTIQQWDDTLNNRWSTVDASDERT